MNMKQRNCEAFAARIKAEQAAKRPAPARRPRQSSQHASREEQYGRYLDCGPQAWDDRDA